jgi:hypothetical protein
METIKGRPMHELRRLVAEDTARWNALGEVWPDLTVAQQRELVLTAKEMAGVKQA